MPILVTLIHQPKSNRLQLVIIFDKEFSKNESLNCMPIGQ